MDQPRIAEAARRIAECDVLVIGAGAGMGVDSGLPDFRGNEGFWKAYPPFAKLGLGFRDLANPTWFRRDPALAWGFYGHRLNLYRATRPHNGFGILKRWSDRIAAGSFVFTSNVDGQFQAAGFDPDRVMECHGRIGWMQCLRGCSQPVFEAADQLIMVDDETMRAREPHPLCPRCGALARPNILMFGDMSWDRSITDEQAWRFREWLEVTRGLRVVVVELGAGQAVPTVRMMSESVAESYDGFVIRINPREPQVPAELGVGLPMGAFEGLRALDQELEGLWL